VRVRAGRDGDRIAGVHAHRVDVFDRAYDDAVVVAVAHHLHLVFLPAKHRFLDQHLGGGRGIEPALHDVEELLAIIGDAAAGAAEGEGGPDDGRQADLGERVERLDQALFDIALAPRRLSPSPRQVELPELVGLVFGRQLQRLDAAALGAVLVAFGRLEVGGVGEPGARGLKSDPGHGGAEQLAILRLVDSLGPGADHLHAVAGEHARAVERQGGIEGRLAAHGGQQRIGSLLGDDALDDLGRDRLHIGGIRQIGIGHDRGGIGVDQDDPIALTFKRLHRLGAGIIELTGLTDDDRSCANDQDRGNICSLGHVGGSAGATAKWGWRRLHHAGLTGKGKTDLVG
jgi:hypothetical protein